MKRDQLTEFINVVAVLASVAAMTLAIFDFKGIVDSKTTMLLGIGASIYAAVISIYFSRLKQRRLRQRRVFIMYSHRDQPFAKELVAKLKASGYNPWFDVDEIAPGQRIPETVTNGLAQSAVALLLVSKNLDLEKATIGKELKVALATMKSKDESFSPVIPVRLDDTDVPQSLSNVSWIDFRDPEAFERLDRGLKRVLGA